MSSARLGAGLGTNPYTQFFLPINLTQLRNLPFLKQTLPIALETEGSVNAYSQFEGTWANLRVGALIKGEKSEFRYRDWFRKPAGSPAELKAKISRQKIGLVLHDSELSLGNSKMTLSGVVEEALQPRLQLKLRSDSSHLPTWWRLVSPLSFDGVGGTIGWDIVLRKNYASADGWNIHGKLNLADAEFRHKQTGRKIDHLNAAIAFLGTEALLEKGSFRLGSSLITVAAKVTDLTQPSARYQLRSPEIHLIDLQTFLAGKTNRIRNVTASGEIRWQDDAPSLRGTLSSSEGNLEDIPYRELQADVTWSPKGISFKNLSLQAFDGVLRADGYWPAGVDPAQRFTLKSQSESIQLGSLLRAKISSVKKSPRRTTEFSRSIRRRNPKWGDRHKIASRIGRERHSSRHNSGLQFDCEDYPWRGRRFRVISPPGQSRGLSGSSLYAV